VDGEDFFHTLAEDAVFEYVVSVPGYPRCVVGRDPSRSFTAATGR
jgi:hypothetical protein